MIAHVIRANINKDYKAGATIRELAVSYNLCFKTIYKYVIDKRPPGRKVDLITDEAKAQIKAMYADERSMRYIGLKFNIPQKRVSDILNEGWE